MRLNGNWITLGLSLIVFQGWNMSAAEPFVANSDELKVPAYSLPEIFPNATSSIDENKKLWLVRRQELLKLFTEQVYGSFPSAPYQLHCDRIEEGPSLGGKALRQQFLVTLKTEHGSLPIEMLIYSPAKITSAVPCFLSLNFTGNHTVASDSEISVTKNWVRNDPSKGIRNNQTLESLRGNAAARWPIELIVDGGSAVATAYYGDIDPDFDDGFLNGAHQLFPEHRPSAEHADRWGSVAAWAWGLSRMLDAIQSSVPEIDGKHVHVVGHSRLGKAAIWAGVTDERFASVISNNSGCGGAALSKRIFGETVGRINESFPHWFCKNFHQ
jgi:hypothetical protein